jgi:hypothetical protein
VFGCLGLCAMAATVASAEVFNSPDGMFTIEFPARPVLTKAQGRTDKGIAYEESRWSVRNKEGYWSVAMFVYAKPRRADSDANVRGAIAAIKGRLADDQRIMQNGVPGREILIDAGKSGVVRERILWVAGNLYFVVFAGDSAAASSPDVDEFLISFEAAR